MNDLVNELISWAQNEEMINQYYTQHGEVCIQAAHMLGLLEAEAMTYYEQLHSGQN